MSDASAWLAEWVTRPSAIKTKFSEETGGFSRILGEAQISVGSVTKKDMQNVMRFARVLVHGLLEGECEELDELMGEASWGLKPPVVPLG